MSSTSRIFFACLIEILRSRRRISNSAPSVWPSVPLALRRLYSGWNRLASCGSESAPCTEYIFFEKRTTESSAAELLRQSSIGIRAHQSSFILSAGSSYPFIQLLLHCHIMPICLSLSLVLAFMMCIALAVTAFGMHFHAPVIMIVMSDEDDEEECVSVVYVH